MGYCTFFPIGDVMRANMFVFRSAKDEWVRRMIKEPHDTLCAALPGLEKILGSFVVPGKVETAGIDLWSTENAAEKDGMVLIGDAFQGVCPSTGTGFDKVLADVDVLCSKYVPQLVRDPGMGREKIATVLLGLAQAGGRPVLPPEGPVRALGRDVPRLDRRHPPRARRRRHVHRRVPEGSLALGGPHLLGQPRLAVSTAGTSTPGAVTIRRWPAAPVPRSSCRSPHTPRRSSPAASRSPAPPAIAPLPRGALDRPRLARPRGRSARRGAQDRRARDGARGPRGGRARRASAGRLAARPVPPGGEPHRRRGGRHRAGRRARPPARTGARRGAEGGAREEEDRHRGGARRVHRT